MTAARKPQDHVNSVNFLVPSLICGNFILNLYSFLKIFICFRLQWVFIAVCRISLVVTSRGYFLLHAWVWFSDCDRLSCCGSFPHGSDGKESACSARNPGSIPVSGRSPGGGRDNPLQYSCLENPMDRGAG